MPVRPLPRSLAAIRSSTIAVATMLVTASALAQGVPSFNASTPTVVSGSVTIDRGVTTPGTDVYTVGTSTAVLNFTPTDTAVSAGSVINFQGAGTTAIFRSTPGGPDFTVLNRIVPADASRPIALNGHVVSELIDASNSATRGGSVWFYSPGGIVIGDGAVLDIGNLLLTTGDPTGGTGIISSTNRFTTASTPDGNGIVNILSGATVNATRQNSYIAAVAPIVFSRGTVNVNGSAAFVAAENATLTFNQGLFDIQVTVGSSATNAGGFPLQLRGSIGGPSSTGSASPHGIYAVAVPKNDAITMIVQPDGNFGFTPASSIAIENGAIYLQAGGNLSVVPTAAIRDRIVALPQSTSVANISINGGNFTSPVAAQATSQMQVSNLSGGALNFAKDTFLYGGTDAFLAASAGNVSVGGNLDVSSVGVSSGRAQVFVTTQGGAVNIAGQLTVSSFAAGSRTLPTTFNRSGGGSASIGVNTGGSISAASAIIDGRSAGKAGQSATGNTAFISVNGGSIAIAGAASVDSSAASVDSAATGGNASARVAGGSLTVGSLAVTASASGGGGIASRRSGSSGVGGTALVSAASNSSLLSSGAITVTADGAGGSAFNLPNPGAGGSGTGGTVSIISQGTVRALSGSLSSNGTGGSAYGLASAGAGLGGSATIRAQAGTIAFTGTAPTTITANGTGGNALVAPAASFTSLISGPGSAGQVPITTTVPAAGGGAGGAGTGGPISVTGVTTATDPAAVGRVTFGTLSVMSTGTGGAGADATTGSVGGAGGAGTGGITNIVAEAGNGVLTATTIINLTTGTGGNGGAGGTGVAGNLPAAGGAGGTGTGGVGQYGVLTGAASDFSVGSASLGTISVFANGIGGSGGSSAATAGAGGSGNGGHHAVISRGAPVTADNISLSLTGVGGLGGLGAATGLRGPGGAGAAGDGGLVGLARLNRPDRGSFTITGTLSGDTSGASAGDGLGMGGDLYINLTNADATINQVRYTATAATASPTDSLSDFVVSAGRLRIADLSVQTIGDIGIYAFNGGSYELGNVNLDASGSLLFGEGPAANNNYMGGTGNVVPAGTPPTNFNDIDVSGDLTIRVGTDLTFTQDAQLGGSLDIVTPGTLQLANIAAGGNVALVSEGNLTTGDVLAGNSISMISRGAVRAGTVAAALADGAIDGSVEIETQTGAITLGAVSGVGVSIRQGDGTAGPFGAVGTGALRAETVTVDVEGDASIGSVIAGDFYEDLGSEDGFLVALTSNGGSVQVGNVTAKGLIGLAAATSVSAAILSTEDAILVLAGQNVTLGGVTTGEGKSSFISNKSIVGSDPAFAEFEDFGDIDSEFNSSSLPGSVPRRLDGAIAINGPTSTGFLQAAATGAITTAALNVATRITLDSGTTITLADVATPADLSLNADGGISTGAIGANSVTLMSSGGAIRTGTVNAAGRGITLTGATGVSTGNLTAVTRISANGGAGRVTLGNVESSGGAVSLRAGAPLSVGSVRAAGSIDIMAVGTIAAGDMTAGTGPLVADAGAGGIGDGATSNAPAGIAPGFDAFSLDRCDDCSSSAVPLSFMVNYFGNNYSNTFISNNGYLTFNSGQSNFTPRGLGASYSGQPIIAAFFADVDTTNALSAATTYGTGTYVGRPAFGATWNGVGYFNGAANKLNNFQIILANRADTGTGNFDIYYNYSNIGWETGSASGGSNGLGGTSASVGFNAGTGNQPNTFFELPGSLVPGSFVNGGTMPLIAYNANGVMGQVLFTVRNGMVVAPTTGPAAINISNIGTAATVPADIVTGNLKAEAVDIRGAGSVSVGNISVADLNSGGTTDGPAFATTIDAATNLSVRDVTSTGLITLSAEAGNFAAGALQSASAIRLDAAGTISLTGAASGTDATLASGNIAIGANAGISGQSISLTARSTTAPALIGGAADSTQGGYVLDAGEIARLHGKTIMFIQQGQPAGNAQLILRDLTLTGSDGASPNLVGPDGHMSFATPGSIRVTGNVRIDNAAAGNRLTFQAGESFDLVTDAGSIGLFGTGSALSGQLSIAATDMTVGSSQLFALADQTDFDNVTNAEVIAAIGKPAAQPRPEGYLQAGNIDLSASDFIAIQNSGTRTIAGGFTAKALRITSLAGSGNRTTDDALNVVIYGRLADATGAFQTNAATIRNVAFMTGQQAGDLSGFSTPSVVNGCQIGGTGACLANDDGPMPSVAPNIRDLVDDGPLAAAAGEDAFTIPAVRIETAIDLTSLKTENIITDPVASSGNPSLWQSISTVSEGRANALGIGVRNIDDQRSKKPRREKRR